MVFITGGIFGVLAELLLRGYMIWFNLPRKESGVVVTLTLVVVSSFLTAIGVFDNLVSKMKAGLIVPITGFAHAMTSSILDYKNEGFVTGIGANAFKLTGSVILYGVVSAYIFGIIRYLFFGG